MARGARPNVVYIDCHDLGDWLVKTWEAQNNEADLPSDLQSLLQNPEAATIRDERGCQRLI